MQSAPDWKSLEIQLQLQNKKQCNQTEIEQREINVRTTKLWITNSS